MQAGPWKSEEIMGDQECKESPECEAMTCWSKIMELRYGDCTSQERRNTLHWFAGYKEETIVIVISLEWSFLVN